MPKFYVESGPVRLIFDAAAAEQAAVMAFQWTCDRQAEIEAESPLDHLLEAEQRGWQLEDEVTVNEQGFGRWDGEVFQTLDIFEAWLRCLAWPVASCLWAGTVGPGEERSLEKPSCRWTKAGPAPAVASARPP